LQDEGTRVRSRPKDSVSGEVTATSWRPDVVPGFEPPTVTKFPGCDVAAARAGCCHSARAASGQKESWMSSAGGEDEGYFA